MKNKSLREEPREQLAEVIPVRQHASILDWLESTGRLRDRETRDDQYTDEEEEIAELMGSEDSFYDEDDDDDEFVVEEEPI